MKFINYIRTADKDRIMWRSSQWMCFNLSGWKEETWKKNSGLNGNRTHDLCDTTVQTSPVSQRSWVRFPFKPEFFQVSSFQPLKLKHIHCDDLHIILRKETLTNWNWVGNGTCYGDGYMKSVFVVYTLIDNNQEQLELEISHSYCKMSCGSGLWYRQHNRVYACMAIIYITYTVNELLSFNRDRDFLDLF